LYQTEIPIHEQVESVCEILGYDPLYLACEGRVVAIVAEENAKQVLEIWQALDSGVNASIIGEIRTGGAQVVLETELGGERFLEELEDDPLPRIC